MHNIIYGDSSKILHIGANNALGRAASHLRNVDVISHKRLEHVDIGKYGRIEVSAFDPHRKTYIVDKNPIIDFLAERVNSTQKIIYFSSARLLQKAENGIHFAYISNKLYDERYLGHISNNYTIIYLPVIVPISSEDNSKFFDIIFSNFAKGFMEFDVNINSSWNVVFAEDVIKTIGCNKLLDQRYYVGSRHSLILDSLKDFLLKKNSDLKLSFGDRERHYPEKVFVKKLYTQNDLGLDVEWLEKVGKKYAQKT